MACAGDVPTLEALAAVDPVAALIVGFMVAKMGWSFGWDAMHDLMDRSVDEQEVTASRPTWCSGSQPMGPSPRSA